MDLIEIRLKSIECSSTLAEQSFGAYNITYTIGFWVMIVREEWRKKERKEEIGNEEKTQVYKTAIFMLDFPDLVKGFLIKRYT